MAVEVLDYKLDSFWFGGYFGGYQNDLAFYPEPVMLFRVDGSP